MKTSVIEVHDMLSVLTVDAVEKRIDEVPGVKSATVNYAAGNATVRYDETLLEIADIKVLANQRGRQTEGEPQAKDMSEDKHAGMQPETPLPDAAPASSPGPAAPKVAQGAPAAMPNPTAATVKNEEDKPNPNAPPAPAAAALNA